MINRIKQLDLVEAIDSCYPLIKRGKSWVACCPFHNEKSPSFSVTEKKGEQFFYCFGCQEGGDLIKFYQLYYDMSFSQAVTAICNKYGIEQDAPPKNYISKAKREEIEMDKMIMLMAKDYKESGVNITYKDKQRIKLAEHRLKNLDTN